MRSFLQHVQRVLRRRAVNYRGTSLSYVPTSLDRNKQTYGRQSHTKLR